MGLVLALSTVSAAQTVGAVSEGSLRPLWSDSAMAEGWRRSAATGAVDFPRLVSKVLPHDALGQAGGHGPEPTTCYKKGG